MEDFGTNAIDSTAMSILVFRDCITVGECTECDV